MITEELKTFINKMRAAGKTDAEIVAELKAAGWEERAINQELSSKTRLDLGKMKFWIWLYGIAFLLSIASAIFSQIPHSRSNVVAFSADLVVISELVYTFFIVPITTILALEYKLFAAFLKAVFKLSLKQLDHKWLLIVSTVIAGASVISFGSAIFGGPGPRSGIVGIVDLMMVLIGILGEILLILSFIFGLVLIILKIVRWKKSGFK